MEKSRVDGMEVFEDRALLEEARSWGSVCDALRWRLQSCANESHEGGREILM